MLKAKLIPAPLIEHHEREPLTIENRPQPSRFRSSRVVWRFLHFWLTLQGLRLTRRYSLETRAERLRQLFEDLGGLWVKVGQLLSLRADILDPVMCRELSRLQYRAIGFPPETARAIIEADLGKPLGAVFSEFEMAPLAAASICQVHKAVLRYRDIPVVVKVQRPEAGESFKRDMALVRWLINRLIGFGVTPHMRWRDFLWELEQIMLEELDYRYEAAHLRRMRASLRRHQVYVPKAYVDHCTPRILVMEFVPGVLMSDYISVSQHDPTRLMTWEKANNVNPEKVAKRLFCSTLRQLLEDNLFHADLHPGNILLLKNSRVALIDLGTVGTVEQEFLRTYRLSLSALVARDFARAADYTLHYAPEAPTNVLRLREDLIRCYRLWEAKTHLRNLDYHQKSLGSAGTESGQVLMAYKVPVNWALLKISRTMTTLDASLSYLMPSASYTRLFKTYLRQAQKRQMKGGIVNRAKDSLREMLGAADEYGALLSPAIRQQTLVLKSMGTRANRFVRVVYRYLTYLAGGSTIIVGWLGLYQSSLESFDDYMPRIVLEHAAHVPRIPDGWWLLLFLGGVLVTRMFRRLTREADQC
ncbi:MAG: ubiquinone biosynthesis protein [Pseudomonadota bacterium]|nr:ubiquinone biosynthesis protein [Pseudomonadota bacterium]